MINVLQIYDMSRVVRPDSPFGQVMALMAAMREQSRFAMSDPQTLAQTGNIGALAAALAQMAAMTCSQLPSFAPRPVRPAVLNVEMTLELRMDDPPGSGQR